MLPESGVDEELLLTDAEFELLTPDEQERYIGLLEFEYETWTLTPKQLIADRTADHCDETLFGGSAGPGKSEWILHRVNRLAQELPGAQILVLRSSFPKLRRSLIRRSVLLFNKHNPEEHRPKWRAADKEWRYPNDSVVEFGYAESDEDVGQYLSAEYDVIAFDELTEFSQYQYDMIRSRARTTRRMKAKGSRPHVIAATNPGQQGHAWVKERFVVGTGYGDHETDINTTLPDGTTVSRHVGFIHATVLDNPHIDPGYVATLMSLPDKLRKQYLEGSWDIFEGQYFTDWSQVRVRPDGSLQPWHVCQPFEIPHEWPRFRAVDYGTFHPYVCGWFTVDGDGVTYLYRETYATQMTATEQAEQVLSLSVCSARGVTRAERFDWTVADPSMWASRSAQSPAMQYAKAGVPLLKGDNERIAGWNRMREYLRSEVTRPDGEIVAGFQVFSTCTETIRSIPDLIHDKNRPEDLDTTGDDHCADMIRYYTMRRPRHFIPQPNPDPATMEERVRAMIASIPAPDKRPRHPELGVL